MYSVPIAKLSAPTSFTPTFLSLPTSLNSYITLLSTFILFLFLLSLSSTPLFSFPTSLSSPFHHLSSFPPPLPSFQPPPPHLLTLLFFIFLSFLPPPPPPPLLHLSIYLPSLFTQRLGHQARLISNINWFVLCYRSIRDNRNCHLCFLLRNWTSTGWVSTVH